MNKNKKITVLITIFYFANFMFNALGESLIIPKEKPQISSEKKITSELKSEILPLKKPKLEEKKTTDVIKEEIQKKKLGIIIPKNKPLVVTKKKVEKQKKILKSKFYKRKDFEIAKKSISLMEKKKWETAIKTSKKARDKSIYNFIVWRYLLERRNNADYSLYNEFLERNNSYPRIGRVKYLSEKNYQQKI